MKTHAAIYTKEVYTYMRVFADLPLTTAHDEIFLHELKFSDTVISFFLDTSPPPYIVGIRHSGKTMVVAPYIPS